MASTALAIAAMPALAADGVEVNHLGTNNTLVRVTGEGKYLLLPVQENNDDARINVLVKAKLPKQSMCACRAPKPTSACPLI